MDRFEILKYTILLEEYIKRIVIKIIIEGGAENSFTNPKDFENWLISVKSKLSKFGKKNSEIEEAIYHCSAKEFVNLFNMIKWEIRHKITESTFLIDIMGGRVSKMQTVLKGNKLVRDTLAHPTLNVAETLNKMTTFTFLPKDLKTNIDRITYFYQKVKDNI